MGYTNSPLVDYKRTTKNKTLNRNHKIDTLTPHCYVGQVTAKQGVDYFFNTNRQASSNYIIGFDGTTGLSVDEKDRAWTSSSSSNDHRAVTIEVACDPKHPYKITNAAYNALIELMADICIRNDIEKLVWSKSKKNRLNRKNGANITVHRDFAATACPGKYLYDNMGKIAKAVNKLIKQKKAEEKKPATTTKPAVVSGQLYRVRTSWDNAGSQIGAYKSLEGAIKACKQGYKVFDSKGTAVYVPTTSKKKTNQEVAKEVIQGKWGNGQTRINKLKAAGYDPDAIQKIVNKLL